MEANGENEHPLFTCLKKALPVRSDDSVRFRTQFNPKSYQLSFSGEFDGQPTAFHLETGQAN